MSSEYYVFMYRAVVTQEFFCKAELFIYFFMLYIISDKGLGYTLYFCRCLNYLLS